MARDIANLISEIAENKVFKGDDGYSEVPDVELDDELPEVDLEKKYKNQPGLTAAEANKRMKNHVNESEEDDEDSDDEDEDDSDDEVNEMFESIFGESYDELDSLVESILSEEGDAKRRGPPARTEAEKRLAKEIAKRVALVHYYDKGKKVGTNYRASNKTNPETLRKEVEVMKMQLAKLRAQRIKGSNSKTKQRADQWGVTKEDINVSDDLSAIFGSESDLSEEFKNKVKTIYEASLLTAANAVVNKVVANLKESYDNYSEELENQIREEYDSKVETIAELADNYIEKAIVEWKEENKLSIEESIRTKINESFIKKLHTLFEEHYIDVPDSRVDLVEELNSELNEMKRKLNKYYSINESLEEELIDLKKSILIQENSFDLTENEKEKFKLLSENVDFDDNFSNTLSEIKSAYFSKTKKAKRLDENYDPIVLTEENNGYVKSSDSTVNSIAAVLAKYSKK